VILMSEKKKSKKIIISASILTLLVTLLVGNIVYAKTMQSQQEMKKAVKAKEIEVAQNVSDLAIKTFDIDTKEYKIVFFNDLEEVNTDSAASGNITSNEKNKATAAYVMLGTDQILKPGDKLPVCFLGENEALIAIQHNDGNMSLIKYDVSKDVSKNLPIKADHIVKKEVK